MINVFIALTKELYKMLLRIRINIQALVFAHIRPVGFPWKHLATKTYDFILEVNAAVSA